MNETNLEVMATFSHPLRVQLMQLLSGRKMTVQELADELPISAGGIRPHIGYFADRKLLHTERRGRSVRYWLNRERLAEALADFGSGAGIDVRMLRSWKVEDPDKTPKKSAKTKKTRSSRSSRSKTRKRKTSKRKTSKSPSSRAKKRQGTSRRKTSRRRR